MGIGGKIRGKIALDVEPIAREGSPQARVEIMRAFRAIRQELENPDPGEGTKGDFQAASPVDSQRVGIGALPGVELAEDFFRIPAIVGQQAGLGQRDQVLMPVEFPCELVVADGDEIEERDLVPGHKGSALLVERVEMPVDLRSVVKSRVAQQSKL